MTKEEEIDLRKTELVGLANRLIVLMGNAEAGQLFADLAIPLLQSEGKKQAIDFVQNWLKQARKSRGHT